MSKTPIVDQNEQCPICHRWFKEGPPIEWHMKAKHGPDSERYHKIFIDNVRKSKEKKLAQGEIIVTIKNGSCFVEARGVKGPACKNLTADLEKALGKVVEDKATREMHEKPQRIRQNQ